MLLHDGGDVGAFERYVSRQHLMENYAEAVNVTASISLFAGPLLRRHVSRRTNYANRLGGNERTKQIRRLDLGETEIEDANLLAHRPAGFNHYVEWFEIPVNDAVFVSSGQCRRYHLHVFKCFRRSESSLVEYDGLKRHALNKFHYDVRNFFSEQSVIQDGDYVGVTNCGCGHRFLMKPLHEGCVVTDEIEFNRLDGASGFQKFVMRLVDNSHPAFTEPAFEHVLTIERNAAGQRVKCRGPVVWTVNSRVVVTAKTGGAFSHVGGPFGWLDGEGPK